MRAGRRRRHGDWLRDVIAHGLEPAVARPFHRLEDRLPAEVVEPVFVRVIDHVPLRVGAFHQGGVPFRPPAFISRLRPDDGVIGRVLPRALDGLRSRRNHHVARGWPGGAAFREYLVVAVSYTHLTLPTNR